MLDRPQVAGARQFRRRGGDHARVRERRAHRLRQVAAGHVEHLAAHALELRDEVADTVPALVQRIDRHLRQRVVARGLVGPHRRQDLLARAHDSSLLPPSVR